MYEFDTKYKLFIINKVISSLVSILLIDYILVFFIPRITNKFQFDAVINGKLL